MNKKSSNERKNSSKNQKIVKINKKQYEHIIS